MGKISKYFCDMFNYMYDRMPEWKQMTIYVIAFPIVQIYEGCERYKEEKRREEANEKKNK